MAYQTGSANSLADIQNVIQTFLTANGWSWDSGSTTIYKGTMFVKFIAPTADKVLFRGKTALSGGTDTPNDVGMGRFMDNTSGNVPAILTFPCTYFAFLDSDEFYFIVNYDVVRYQFVAWGKSTIDTGTNGTGMFITGSVCQRYVTGGYGSLGCGIDMTIYGNTGNMPWYGFKSVSPFWDHTQQTGAGTDQRNSFIHTDFGSPDWSLAWYDGSYYQMVGNKDMQDLIGVIPNAWNGESPLLPFRVYRRRTEAKVSLVADFKNSRKCRIDNFNDQEIITIGADQWQIFPFHKRSMTSRNAGYWVDHTGTFGWALRKVD